MEKLKSLESDSIKLIKSIPQIAQRPAMLWSTGKDSTLSLFLVRKAFGYFPWPVYHIDTGRKYQEIYDFRDRLKLKWNIPLRIIRNDEAMQLGLGPDKISKWDCCTTFKTNVLKEEVKKRGFDCLLLSIRFDEHYVRGMEDLISKRDEQGNWDPKKAFGGFGLVAEEKEAYNHIRVHPILPWSEKEVWEYTLLNDIPVNPLYFAREAEDGRWYRYRSLGCMPCTEPLESRAQSVQDILSEVYMNPGLERSGRMQDKEQEDAMMKLRQWGYM